MRRYHDFARLCEVYGPRNARIIALGNHIPEGRVRHWLMAWYHLRT